MIGPSTIDFILSNLGISMWDYLTKHKEQFEAVNTGRSAEGEYIYHGPANDPKACRHCGGKLIGKKMTLKSKGPKTWVANGIARRVRDAEGNVFIIWICSCKCESCTRQQRVLPTCIVRFCRYCAHVIYGVMKVLFDDEELVSGGRLKRRLGRGWEQIVFYGEVSTVYRWRFWGKRNGELRIEN